MFFSAVDADGEEGELSGSYIYVLELREVLVDLFRAAEESGDAFLQLHFFSRLLLHAACESFP